MLVVAGVVDPGQFPRRLIDVSTNWIPLLRRGGSLKALGVGEDALQTTISRLSNVSTEITIAGRKPAFLIEPRRGDISVARGAAQQTPGQCIK